MRCAICALICICCARVAAATVDWVDLPEDNLGVIAVSAGGNVAVVTLKPAALHIYPKLSAAKSLAGEISVPLNGKPVALVYHRTATGGFFAVASANEIAVVNESDGKVIANIPTDQPVLDLCAPESADAPYMYYSIAGENRGAGLPALAHRIDLKQMKDTGAMKPDDGFFSDQYAIECSADGRIVYFSRPNTSPTGIYAFAVGADDPNRLTKVYDQHDSVTGYFPAPHGIGTAIKNELHSVDLNDKLRQFSKNVVCVMQSRPVVFLGDNTRNSVTAASLNDAREFATVKLTHERDGAHRRDRGPNIEGSAVRLKRWVFVDEANQTVLCNREREVAIVPLSAFAIAKEPFMAARIAGGTELRVGQAWSASVEPLDPSVTVALGSAPAGMKLEDGKLSWTPTGSNLGNVSVTLLMWAGGRSVPQELNLVVRNPYIRLPFEAGNFAVSPDGMTLVAVAQPDKDQQQRGPYGDNRPSKIAIVDLKSGTVRAQKDLDFAVDVLACGNDAAFMASHDVDALYRLDFAKPQSVSKTFTDGVVQAMTVAGDRLYASLNQRDHGTVQQAYGVADGQPLKIPPVAPSRYDSSGRSNLPVQVGDGWLMSDGVWSNDFSHLLLLVNAPSLPVIASAGDEGEPRIARWGTMLENGQIRKSTGQSVGQLGSANSILLNDFPAAAILKTDTRYDPQEGKNRVTASLVIKDLVDGKETPIGLINELRSRPLNMNDRFGPGSAIASAGGNVYVVIENQLFVIGRATLASLKLPVPLYFEPKQSALLLPGDAPSKLTYAVHGGEKPLRFSLVRDLQGVEINAETGEVTIDPSVLLSSERLDQLYRTYADQSHERRMRERGQYFSPQQDTAAIDFREATTRQSSLVGNWPDVKLNGVPAGVRIGVRVRDARQQEAVLTHLVVLDVPIQPLKERDEKRQEEMTRQRQQMTHATTMSSGQGGEDASALRRRIQELETENVKLKSQVDLLRDMVSRQATSQPAR